MKDSEQKTNQKKGTKKQLKKVCVIKFTKYKKIYI